MLFIRQIIHSINRLSQNSHGQLMCFTCIGKEQFGFSFVLILGSVGVYKEFTYLIGKSSMNYGGSYIGQGFSRNLYLHVCNTTLDR